MKAVMFLGKLRVLTVLMLAAPPCLAAVATPSPSNGATTVLQRDLANCRARASVEACFDAIRRDPSDPALLVALGDALMHAGRPADAMRYYRRAAVILPGASGVGTKISAAEAKLASRRGPATRSAAGTTPGRNSTKHYSNAEPVAQSH
jgi:cytochrome c-type biogenesis protein CcmH/NrfG